MVDLDLFKGDVRLKTTSVHETKENKVDTTTSASLDLHVDIYNFDYSPLDNYLDTTSRCPVFLNICPCSVVLDSSGY